MKTEKVIVNGREQDIVVHLDNEYKDDMVINNINLEDTLELSLDDLHDKLEDTTMINTLTGGSNNG